MEETNVQKDVKTRDTNMELLRIVAMFMVVTLHCIGHGDFLNDTSVSLENYILLRLLDSLSQIANALFLMTTGYYMINKKFNLKRILDLWGKTIFYSFIIWIVCVLLGRETQVLKSLFPVTIGNYWFISAYISLYFLIPIINILLNKLTKSQFKYGLIVLIIMFGIIRVVSNPSAIYSGAIMPVIIIYSIGAYIRKFVEVKHKNKYIIKYILLTIIFALIYMILQIYQGITTNAIVYYRIYLILTGLREYNCIILIAMAICVFMKFVTIKIKSNFANQTISFIAPSMFSIYIIHENININDWLWKSLGIINYADSCLMVPYILLMVLVVFIACLLIDLLRRGVYSLLKKISFVNRLVSIINEKIDKLNMKINAIFESN